MTNLKNKTVILNASEGSMDSSAKAIRMTQESGRSMVEMLGTLAVIGVLSVAGIAGYTTAMTKYKANEILNGASVRAMHVSSQIQAGSSNPTLTEFGSETVSGVGYTANYTSGSTTFSLTLSSVEPEVCTQMKNNVGENSNVNIGDCPATKGNLALTYNTDLSAPVSTGRATSTAKDCVSNGKTWCYETSTCMDPCLEGELRFVDGSCACTSECFAPSYKGICFDDGYSRLCELKKEVDPQEWCEDLNCNPIDGPHYNYLCTKTTECLHNLQEYCACEYETGTETYCKCLDSNTNSSTYCGCMYTPNTQDYCKCLDSNTNSSTYCGCMYTPNTQDYCTCIGQQYQAGVGCFDPSQQCPSETIGDITLPASPKNTSLCVYSSSYGGELNYVCGSDLEWHGYGPC